jgi:cobaltochelatase CobS
MSNQDTIKRLEEIIATSSNPIAVDSAKKQLERLATQGQVQVLQGVTSTEPLDSDVQAVIDALNRVVSGGGGGASASDVRKEIMAYLSMVGITETDLSPSLRAMLNSTRKVEITIKTLTATATGSSNNDFIKRPLVQKILSDVMAKNNAYLYGGAGTGKTFVAGAIADLLDWELITLNCNQFTSPIDIIGGQTIEGYQEGKVSMAWSNRIIDGTGNERSVNGVVLLLDELPKIDPNTAGLLNEALAKVKDFKYDETTDTMIPPTILNGRNQKLSLGNLMVVATGNVALNTIDPDYEANFKQDLSLLDRFIGSTYKVFVDYEYEFSNIMKGFAFIWYFCTRLREKIVELNATGQAFVSIRLMINLKATYIVQRKVEQDKANGIATIIENPKTIEEAMESFLNLFKPSIKDAILSGLPFKEFYDTIKVKDKMPFDADAPNFDTPQEIQDCKALIRSLQP